METEVKYKRGDLSPCGQYRFWQYQAHVRKDGRRSERWIPVHAFDAYRDQVTARNELGDARSEFYKQKRMIPKVDPREYLLKTYGIR